MSTRNSWEKFEASLPKAANDTSWMQAVNNPVNRPYLRNDGTEKGTGWLGVRKNSAGQDVTEYSVGVTLGGKEIEIPTVTPNMNEYDLAEIDAASSGKGQLSDRVINKAVEFARSRLLQGQSPFKTTKAYK